MGKALFHQALAVENRRAKKPVPNRTRDYVSHPGPGAVRCEAWRSALAQLPMFDDWLLVCGRSRTTRARYVGVLRRWWLYALSWGSPPDADRLVAWFGHCRRRVGQGTLNVAIAALRAWNTWAAQTMRPGLLVIGVASLRLSRPPHRLVRAVSAADVDALLASIPDDWLGLRDRTLIGLLYDAGLRASEAAALELGDQLMDGTLLIRAGKGGRDRITPITSRMTAELSEWIRRRREARPGRCRALFITRQGRRLGGGPAVWRIVRARTVGGPLSGVSPKWFRAGMATALISSGCPLPAVSEMLGHESAESTARYIAPDMDAMRRAVARHPRNRGPRAE